VCEGYVQILRRPPDLAQRDDCTAAEALDVDVANGPPLEWKEHVQGKSNSFRDGYEKVTLERCPRIEECPHVELWNRDEGSLPS
jgi:hypothetical protein